MCFLGFYVGYLTEGFVLCDRFFYLYFVGAWQVVVGGGSVFVLVA